MKTEKRCPRCSTLKPVGHFGTNLGSADGYRSACKACEAARQRAKYAELLAARSGNPPDPDKTPPVAAPRFSAPPPAPLPPLENAFAQHTEAAAKRDLKAEHKALIEETSRLRRELETFTQAARAPEILIYDKPRDERADAVACAVASDWHVEEPVHSADVMGLNEYNLDVAKSRSAAFFKNALRLTDIFAKDSTIRTLHLSLLGDFFSGWIHEELLANTLLAPGDAAVFVNGLLCSGIDFLMRESSYRLEVDALPGNHGRMTDKMHFGDPTGTSLETVMYHMVAARYADNPRVAMRVASASEVHVRFFETFKMRLVHGYEVKYSGGVGGITIPLNKRLAQWNSNASQRCDLTVLGHYHQFFDGGRFLVNGSMIGYNNFAKNFGFTYEDPQQAFFLVHASKGGRKSVVAPIWLDEKHPAQEPPAPSEDLDLEALERHW